MPKDLSAERAAFERWRDIERPSLMRHTIAYSDLAELQAEAIAWDAWNACWPLARAAIYGAEQAQIEAPLRAEIARLTAERDAFKQMVHDELDCNLRLRDLGGAKPDEGMSAYIERVIAERDALREDAERWLGLYRRAVNVANGLTNYVEERPELRRAERELSAIEADYRAAIDAARKAGGG